jgi:regulator of sigma E protease
VLTLIAFLFVLGVLVFVHELGHFLVARAYGVRVVTFSLGF